MRGPRTPRDIQARLAATLREKGYRLTSQRRAIIGLLARDRSHPGAADILNKVRKALPQVSLSTVYYTLDLLKKERLLQELEFYDRDNRYDINVTDHINLICRSCGRIEDLPGKPPYSYAQVRRKSDFQPVGMRYEYYGYCRACRRKRAG